MHNNNLIEFFRLIQFTDGIYTISQKITFKNFLFNFYSQVKNSHSMKNSFDIFSLVVLIIYLYVWLLQRTKLIWNCISCCRQVERRLFPLSLSFFSRERIFRLRSRQLSSGYCIAQEEEIMRDRYLREEKYMLCMHCVDRYPTGIYFTYIRKI